MILYNPECDLRLTEYGIEIPVADDRGSRVFSSMLEIDSTLTYFDLKNIPILTQKDLLFAHDFDFVSRLFGNEDELQEEIMTCYELIDNYGNYFRYNPLKAKNNFNQMFKIILQQAGMTYLSNKNALKKGFSYYLGGGMHHAMSFQGRGFCLINDLVISLRKLQKENLIQSAWVIDVDAHKGDGTAELTQDDSSIVTLSLHMKKGWPLDSKEESSPCFLPSNIDVAIDLNEESLYLLKLKAALLELEQNYKRPDIAIIVNGADPFEHDELQSTEGLKLTKEQMLERDKMVYHFLKERNIPQSYVMAGGYGKRSWEIYAQFLKFVWQNTSKRSEVSSR